MITKTICRENRLRIPLALIIFLALSPASWALEIQGTCYITFLGTSTLHDFTGTVRSEPFTVNTATNGKQGKVIRTVIVDVPVDEIETGKSRRDEQMREMFESKKFPRIQGSVKNIDPDQLRRRLIEGKNGEAPVELTLSIRDIEHTFPVTFKNFREFGEQISFEVEFFVSLAAYELKPPSLLLGLIRVGDTVTVTVTFDLEVKPAELFSRENNRLEK